MGLMDMRKRSQITKQIQEQRNARIKSAIDDVVNSSSFQLTAANHVGNDASEDAISKFANEVVDKVSHKATDPVLEFMDMCKARKMKESRIEKAVDIINTTFGLVPEESVYDDKLRAVAEYIQANPQLYEDIAVLG